MNKQERAKYDSLTSKLQETEKELHNMRCRYRDLADLVLKLLSIMKLAKSWYS